MALVEPPPRLGLNRIRTGSHPSLTHSSTTDGDHTNTGSSTCGGPESLLTPNTRYGDRGMLQLSESDEEIMDDDDPFQGAVPRGYEMRNGMVTRSIPDLKTAAGVQAGGQSLPSGRDRSLSTGASQTITPGGQGKPGYAIPSRPPNALISYPSAASSSRYQSQTKSKSGFASFLRKLTGKKPKEPKEKVANPMDVLSRPDAPFRPVSLPDPTPMPMMRSMSSTGPGAGPGAMSSSTMAGRRPPMPSRIQTEQLSRQATMPYQTHTMPARRPTNTPPLSAPPVMAPMLAHYPVLAPVSLAKPISRREEDPLKIPLPPSPLLAAQALPSPTIGSSGEVDLIDFNPTRASIDAGLTGGSGGSAGSRRTGEVPAAEGSALGLDRHASRASATSGPAMVVPKPVDMDEEEEGEEDDLPAPLPMIRIPSSSSAQGRREPSLAHSPLSASSADMPSPAGVPIPSTKREISPPGIARSAETRPTRASQLLEHTSRSLPPGAAPADPASLGRRDSKWRQSVMNLSDSVNGRSHRGPPSSYDSYNAAQRRKANNRVSCQPTMHSAASIAEQLRTVQNKEEAEMAENFFM